MYRYVPVIRLVKFVYVTTKSSLLGRSLTGGLTVVAMTRNNCTVVYPLESSIHLLIEQLGSDFTLGLRFVNS